MSERGHRVSRTVKFILAVLFLLVAGRPAAAHDIGAMSVTVSFPSTGACRVDVVLDLEHSASGSGFASAALEDLKRGVLNTSDLWLDDQEIVFPQSEAVIERTDAAGTPVRVRVSLSGTAPLNVRSLVWRSRLTVGQYLLRVRTGSAEETTNQWLEGGARSKEVALEAPGARSSTLAVIATYVKLGFTHIVPEGLDHILFVLGLFLLSLKVKPLLAQVTAFTVAHSISLGLSIYGVVRVPPSIVEPAIALSIAYVAIENMFVRKYRPWRTAIVFGFGLLHGMGFAGVLQEMGLPRSEFVPALVSFNVGVELGQLAVLSAAFAAVGFWFGAKQWYRSRVTVPASAAIALVGLYWAVERLGG